MLTEELARCKSTTTEHILNNRLCDRTAKTLAQKLSPVNCQVQREAEQVIELHQKWLIELHAALPTPEAPPTHEQSEVVDSDPVLSPAECQMRFPHWPWGISCSGYKWKPKIPTAIPTPAKWHGTSYDWNQIVSFLRQLRWCTADDQSISFCELALLFHQRNFRFEGDQQILSLYEIYKLMREAMLFLSKQDTLQAFPGLFHSTKPRSCGRVLPQGCIDCAAPWMSDPERIQLVKVFELGAGREIDSWRILLCDL